jgi:hypothetical protein
MTAQFTKLPWRKPKVRVLDWPAFHLPFNNYNHHHQGWA